MSTNEDGGDVANLFNHTLTSTPKHLTQQIVKIVHKGSCSASAPSETAATSAKAVTVAEEGECHASPPPSLPPA